MQITIHEINSSHPGSAFSTVSVENKGVSILNKSNGHNTYMNIKKLLFETPHGTCKSE